MTRGLHLCSAQSAVSQLSRKRTDLTAVRRLATLCTLCSFASSYRKGSRSGLGANAAGAVPLATAGAVVLAIEPSGSEPPLPLLSKPTRLPTSADHLLRSKVAAVEGRCSKVEQAPWRGFDVSRPTVDLLCGCCSACPQSMQYCCCNRGGMQA